MRIVKIRLGLLISLDEVVMEEEIKQPKQTFLGTISWGFCTLIGNRVYLPGNSGKYMTLEKFKKKYPEEICK